MALGFFCINSSSLEVNQSGFVWFVVYDVHYANLLQT